MVLISELGTINKMLVTLRHRDLQYTADFAHAEFFVFFYLVLVSWGLSVYRLFPGT